MNTYALFSTVTTVVSYAEVPVIVLSKIKISGFLLDVKRVQVC